MFRDLAAALGANLPNNANIVLTQFAPTQLAQYLELVWSAPRPLPRGTGAVAGDWNLPAVFNPPTTATPFAFSRSMGRTPAEQFAAAGPGLPPPFDPWANAIVRTWDHIIYAYMIENSGVVEVMRRLLTEWLSDERLPYASLETQHWLRATEEMFFTSPNSYFHSLTSSIRPDATAIRENAYHRLLGMDLAFRPASGPTTYPRSRSANTEFVRDLERLLFEVWRGYINRLNANNENRTDRQAVAELVQDLSDMLNSRRTNATLLREEFSAVATLSWFHLTLQHNTLVVNNLNAQAATEAARLSKIAAQVGMQSSRVADSYFRLADPLSSLMIIIENGALIAAGVETLYDGTNVPLNRSLQQIIAYWEKATGRSIKEASAVRPLQVPVATQITSQSSVLNRLAGVTAPI